MVPNLSPNARGRKEPKRGRKPRFDPAIFEERFRTIERLFAWEDKFRRLLLRFERLSRLHYAFKTIDYTMINLRHYCRGRSYRRCLRFLFGAPRRDSARPLHGENPLVTAPIIISAPAGHPIPAILRSPQGAPP
jgi:hypothetical protein